MTAAVLLASLLLGGGTRPGLLSDALLQLVSVPALVIILGSMLARGPDRAMPAAPVLICSAIVLLPLVQLVPLPPFIWTLLPHRAPSAEAFELMGRKLPWMPLSVAPDSTWLSLLSLIPPVAVFLGTLLIGSGARRALSLAVIGIGVVSVFAGLLQVAQGPASPLRLYAVTNPTEAVGFFANRNHFAAFLYCALLLTAAWCVHSVRERVGQAPPARFEAGSVAPLVFCFAAVVALVAGVAVARSRAGLVLTMVAILSALVLAGRATRHDRSGLAPAAGAVSSSRLILSGVALAAVFALQFALYRMLDRFGRDPLEDARVVFAENTWSAALAYMPAGSGMGSFVRVYGLFERPQDLLADTFVNHAHNDVLEITLEAGVPGLVLLAVFVAWLARRALLVWRSGAGGAPSADLLLARSASLIIVLLLAHSAVDYPLRTGAMMAVFAFAAGLLAAGAASAPAEDAASKQSPVQTERAHSLDRQAPGAQMPLAPLPGAGARLDGDDADWPAAWRKPRPAAPQGAARDRKGGGSDEPGG